MSKSKIIWLLLLLLTLSFPYATHFGQITPRTGAARSDLIPLEELSRHTRASAGVREAAQGAPRQTAVDCEGCSQVAVTPPPLPAAAPPPPDVSNKWDLWTHGTLLRGANIWQRCLSDDDDPCESFETAYDDADFKKLREWGANYVNISHAGIYSERPIKKDGRGPRAYRRVDKALANLLRLIELSRQHGLFVVVSFRTGPGRNEAVFDTDEKDPLTTLWETKRGALTEKAVDAQNVWIEMWREAAAALKDKSNVIGYDLMVEPQQEVERRDGVDKKGFWFALAERLAGAVRCVDTRTPILIGGANESSACELSCIDPGRFGRYERVVYTAHQYHPYDEYTHQQNKYAKHKCERGVPRVVDPGRRDPHTPRAFDKWVAAEMYSRYEYVYGFKVKHAAQVAVNEFGVVRYASDAAGKRDADKATAYEKELNERIGANHALWLWETRACIGYDAMNFKHGVDPKNHVDIKPEDEDKDPLIQAIKANWRSNKIYATQSVLDRLDAEKQPPLPPWLSCPRR